MWKVIKRWFKREKKIVFSDDRFHQVFSILFPDVEFKTDEHDNHYIVDYSVDRNLDSILVDLQEGMNDEMVQHNLREICERVSIIRQILEVETDYHPQAKYLVIGSNPNDPKVVDFSGMDRPGKDQVD